MQENPDIENRIENEIIVDTYGHPQEQAMSWHCYIDDRLELPFQARCIKTASSYPLKVEQEVTVISMADPDECLRDMLVTIEYDDVPLSQLELIKTHPTMQEVIGDWHYWVARGYLFE